MRLSLVSIGGHNIHTLLMWGLDSERGQAPRNRLLFLPNETLTRQVPFAHQHTSNWVLLPGHQ